MPGITSVLKEIIEQFPTKQTVKGKDVEPFLKKRGVKDEELEFSGMRENIDPNASYTKEDLQSIESQRKDVFTSQDVDNTGYEKVTPSIANRFGTETFRMPQGQISNNYRETTYSFRQDDAVAQPKAVIAQAYESTPGQAFELLLANFDSNDAWKLAEGMANGKSVDELAALVSSKNVKVSGRYVTEHFPEERNYLAHVRADKYKVDGNDTNVIYEFQSDLHQIGRQKGYSKLTEGESELNAKIAKLAEYKRDFDEAYDGTQADVDELRVEYNKWLKENDLPDWEADELLDHLQRTQRDKSSIPNSPWKKTWLPKLMERELLRANEEGVNQIAIPISGPNIQMGTLQRGEGVQKWYETAVTQEARKIARKTNSSFKEIEEDGIKYAVIQTTPKSKLDFKLYSGAGAVGLGMAGASESEAAALTEEQKAIFIEKGYSEKQIAAFEQRLKIKEKLNLKGQPGDASTLRKAEAEAVKAKPQKYRKAFQFPEQQSKEIDELTNFYRKRNIQDLEIARFIASRTRPEYDLISQDMLAEPTELIKSQIESKAKDVGPKYIDGILAEIPMEDSFTAANKILNNDMDYVIEQAKQLGVDPRTKVGMDAIYKAAIADTNIKQAKFTVQNIKEINEIMHPWQWIKSLGGDTRAEQAYQELVKASSDNIIKMAQERGITLVEREGEFFVQLDDGTESLLSSSLLDELNASKYEIAGGMTGAAIGTLAVGNWLAANAGPYGKKSQAFLKGVGALYGSVIGSTAGEQVDYLIASANVHEDWTSKVAIEKAIGTAHTTALMDLGIGGGFVVLAKSAKSLSKVSDFLLQGNVEGAVEATAKVVGDLTPAQRTELTTRWKDLNKMYEINTNSKLEDIYTMTMTQPGGERIVSLAQKVNPNVTYTITKDVTERAKALNEIASESLNPNLGQDLIRALDSYESGVKTQFQVAKEKGTSLVPQGYKFNFDDTAIKTIIDHQAAVIDNPAVSKRLSNILLSIDSLSTSRTFEDLLDLRTVVNQFKYSTKKLSKKDRDLLSNELAAIDSEINKVISMHPNGKEWLGEWKNANIEYSKYLKSKDNAIIKALTPKKIKTSGLNADTLAKLLLKHSKAIDPSVSSVPYTQSTMKEFLSKLPAKLRVDTEASIFNVLSNKYTLGKEGEFQAVHWPELDKALQDVEFTTREAQSLKQAVHKMAEVYRNDPRLLQAVGSLKLETYSAPIATSFEGKIKQELVNLSYRRVKRLKPGSQADAIAMVEKVAKLLDEPLDAKASREVIKAARNDHELLIAISKIQQEAARDLSEGKVVPRVKLFKQGGNFNINQVGKDTAESVPVHRVVQSELAQAITGKEDLTRLTHIDKVRLLDNGFLIVVLPDGKVINLQK